MSVSRKSLLVFVLVFLCASAVGFTVGGYAGGNFGMGVILNNTITRDARDVRTLVAALRDIRTGSPEAGIQAIETVVYDHIVVFDPVEPYPNIEVRTEAEVEAAINAAFEYYRAFPRDSRLAADEAVKNVFERRGLE